MSDVSYETPVVISFESLLSLMGALGSAGYLAAGNVTETQKEIAKRCKDAVKAIHFDFVEEIK